MKRTKILALFLAMVMVFSMGTIAVSAADDTVTQISTSEELRTFLYSDNVKGILTTDIEYNFGSITITTEKYLDLGGYTITIPETVTTPQINLDDNANFTITNGTYDCGTACSGAIDTNDYCTNVVINIENMVFLTEYYISACLKFSDGAVVTIKDTTINSVDSGAIYTSYGGDVHVYDCNVSITSTQAIAPYNSSAIALGYGDYGSEITVYSGTYTSAGYGVYVFSTGGIINVYGGEFTADLAVLKANNSTTSQASEIYVYGGTFDGAIVIDSAATLEIEGGTFTNTGLTAEELSVYVTNEDYQVVELADGSLGVVEEICTVDFVTNNETTADAVTGKYGEAITFPTLELDGYTFTGWYTDEACTEAYTSETFTASMTLYAGWDEIVEEETETFNAFIQFFIDLFNSIIELFKNLGVIS